jgi:pimeloyl-ACP methyl ester carboxylesterase
MSTPDTVLLALPGMTLNETEFPDFGLPTLCARYATLFDCPSDAVARAGGMVPYVEGLEAWLATRREWLDAERRIVLGHSFGALLALAWLTSSPHSSVSGLILISASPGPLFRRVRLGVGTHLRLPLAPLLPLWNTRLVTRTVKRLCTGGSLDPEEVNFHELTTPTDRAVDRAGWRNVEWRRLRAMRLAMYGFDVRERLHRIRAQTIVLHGERDPLFAVEDARTLATAIPRAELHVIAGAGHALPLSHPGVVVAAVRDLTVEQL